MQIEVQNNQKTTPEHATQEKLAADLWREMIVYPLTFGAGFAAANGTAEILTKKTLSVIPEERTGALRWWQSNASSPTKGLFAAQEADLSRHLAEVRTARILDTRVSSALNQTTMELHPHFMELANRHFALKDASTATLHVEASSLSTIARGSKNIALAECTRFLTGDQLALHSRQTVDLVTRYRTELRSGGEVSAAHRQLLEAHSRELAALAHNPALRESAERTLRQQYEFLIKTADLRVDGKAAVSTIGTAAEVSSGEKLFVRGTRIAELIESTAAGLKSAEQVSAERAIQETALVREVELSAKVAGSSAFNTAANAGGRLLRGISVAAVFTAGGYCLDYKIAEQMGVTLTDKRDASAARLAIDGCLVPAFLLNDMPLKFRVPLAATAFGAGRLTNLIASDVSLSPELSRLLKPNHADTFLLGAAIMTPLSAKYKALGISGALVAGRVFNLH